MIAPAIKAAPLRNPRRALSMALEHLNLNPVRTNNVPIFCPKGSCCTRSAERTSWNSPLTVRPQPDNKFCPINRSGSWLERAGGFQRGRLCARERPASAPLWLTSLVPFLFSDKKVTLPHLLDFCSLNFLHRGCGMWKTFLWKTVTKKILPQVLLKTSFFQHLTCG